MTLSASQGAADDGSVVLLRCWFLHPQKDVSVPSERRAGVQRLLHPALRHHTRYDFKQPPAVHIWTEFSGVSLLLSSFPAARKSAGLRHQRDDRGWARGCHDTPGVPSTARLRPYDDGFLPATSILLQSSSTILRTNISKQRQEVTARRWRRRWAGGSAQEESPSTWPICHERLEQHTICCVVGKTRRSTVTRNEAHTHTLHFLLIPVGGRAQWLRTSEDAPLF